MCMATTDTLERPAALLRGRRLEYFTIAWNTLEGLVALVTGIIAGSISLVGFGIDSFIEVTSGSVLLWRMSVDSDANRGRGMRSGRYELLEHAFSWSPPMSSTTRSWTCGRSEPLSTALREVFWLASPSLSCLSSRVPSEMWGEPWAVHADAKQTEFCTYLSGILLAGLSLNALFGLWWADPVAGLVMVPIVAKEGIAGLQGRACDDCSVR
jgi:hypothetical protein